MVHPLILSFPLLPEIWALQQRVKGSSCTGQDKAKQAPPAAFASHIQRLVWVQIGSPAMAHAYLVSKQASPPAAHPLFGPREQRGQNSQVSTRKDLRRSSWETGLKLLPCLAPEILHSHPNCSEAEIEKSRCGLSLLLPEAPKMY